MSNLKNSDIKELMVNVATTHPLIGHDVGDPKKIRFYGFNPDEFDTGSKTKLNFDTLIMGLSIPRSAPVTWTFVDTGTSTYKQKFFEVAVLGRFAEGDYAAEDLICERAEEVLDDFETWLDDKSAGEDRCDFEVIEYIDRANISCRRVNNIGIACVSGSVMRVPLKEWVVYDSADNPLNAMVP